MSNIFRIFAFANKTIRLIASVFTRKHVGNMPKFYRPRLNIKRGDYRVVSM